MVLRWTKLLMKGNVRKKGGWYLLRNVSNGACGVSGNKTFEFHCQKFPQYCDATTDLFTTVLTS
jgi:hypothetical protein